MPGNRKSIRLAGYDYTSAGGYFVTICVQGGLCLLGDIVNDRMVLNDAGQMIAKWYQKSEINFPGTGCDEYIIMPNHFHAIIRINGAEAITSTSFGIVRGDFERAHTRVRPYYEMESNTKTSVGADPCVCPSENDNDRHPGLSLHRVVQWFKTMTTNSYIRGVNQNTWPAFHRRLWQRNYFERSVRNDHELKRIRKYISQNPSNWDEDRYNPLSTR